MSRPGDPVNIGDDVGGGQEPGRFAKIIDMKDWEGAPLLLIRKYMPGDADGEPTGEYRETRWAWPTEWDSGPHWNTELEHQGDSLKKLEAEGKS